MSGGTDWRVQVGIAWKRTVSINQYLDDESVPFETMRDNVVRALRESSWFKDQADGSALHNSVEHLAIADDEREFDYNLDEIYDLADIDRTLIN